MREIAERRSVDLGATFLRLVVTLTTPLSAAARHYVSTNLSASAIEEVEAGVVDSGGRTPFCTDTPGSVPACWACAADINNAIERAADYKSPDCACHVPTLAVEMVERKPNADAQKDVKMIGSDKAKIQIYCHIVELGDQIDETNPKDKKKIDELDQRMDELAAKLGPEYVTLTGGLEEMDPNSKDSKEINSTLEGLDKLCPK